MSKNPTWISHGMAFYIAIFTALQLSILPFCTGDPNIYLKVKKRMVEEFFQKIKRKDVKKL